MGAPLMNVPGVGLVPIGGGGTQVVTSTTRPSSPYSGMEIFESDTKRKYIWDGTAWVYLGGGTDPTFHRTRIEKNANQAIGTAQAVTLSWQTIVYDIGSLADLAGNRLVIQKDGVYNVSTGCQWATPTAGVNIGQNLLVAGNARAHNLYQGSGNANNWMNQTYMSWAAFLTAGTVIQTQVWHHHGSNLNAQNSTWGGGQPGTFLEAEQVG